MKMIVFSGTDGAGKSTQISLLETSLREQGRRTAYFWARGGYTPLFSLSKRAMRRMQIGALPNPGMSRERERKFASSRVRRVWLLLAIGDLVLCYGVWLRLLRWSGCVVLCDRYIEDTLLDFRLRFPQERVGTWFLWRILAKVCARPDHRLLLLVPPEESARRAILKHDPYPDSLATLAWRHAQYQEMARTGKWHIIDCMKSIETVHWEIRGVVKI
ncbi:MAG: hypothetical protein KA257_00085 [Opitutaceae bacterium]|nr:hypothetical protein [Opitutaceae bacterium]